MAPFSQGIQFVKKRAFLDAQHLLVGLPKGCTSLRLPDDLGRVEYIYSVAGAKSPMRSSSCIKGVECGIRLFLDDLPEHGDRHFSPYFHPKGSGERLAVSKAKKGDWIVRHWVNVAQSSPALESEYPVW